MPYVKWMLGAEDLTPEDDMPIGRNVLELTDVRQSANYTCVAMSTLGVIEAVAQITVKGKPASCSAHLTLKTPATDVLNSYFVCDAFKQAGSAYKLFTSPCHNKSSVEDSSKL